MVLSTIPARSWISGSTWHSNCDAHQSRSQLKQHLFYLCDRHKILFHNGVRETTKVHHFVKMSSLSTSVILFINEGCVHQGVSHTDSLWWFLKYTRNLKLFFIIGDYVIVPDFYDRNESKNIISLLISDISILTAILTTLGCCQCPPGAAVNVFSIFFTHIVIFFLVFSALLLWFLFSWFYFFVRYVEDFLIGGIWF